MRPGFILTSNCLLVLLFEVQMLILLFSLVVLLIILDELWAV